MLKREPLAPQPQKNFHTREPSIFQTRSQGECAVYTCTFAKISYIIYN